MFFFTGLRQVDPDLNNLDYRITYVPFDNTTQPMDSVWGFYINSTSNDLDSTLLTDDNYDDYDVYIVYVHSGCDIASQGPGSGCNGNGVCEPQKGETPENCEECANEIQDLGEHTLEVLSVTIKEDKPMFDESWIENKYELDWNWMITENNIGVITTNRNSEVDDLKYNVWMRKELVRCKKNGTKCKGTATPKGALAGSKMFNKFNPSVHSLLIHFCEKQLINGHFYNFTPVINGIPITFPPSLTATFDNAFDVWTNQSYGTFHTVPGPGNNGDGVIFVPGSSFWSAENINGQNYMVLIKTAPAHSGAEIEIKLGYKI